MAKPTSVVTNFVQPARPDQRVTERASEVVAALRELVVHRRLKWHTPAISHDESENTTEISWWRADRSLIITIEPNGSVTFLKVWGPNIHNDMEEGENPSSTKLIELWQWLYT